MRVTTAVLIAHDIDGWPIPVISPRVPLGKTYRVDLDSRAMATLHNPDHPEWGVRRVEAITDLDDAGGPLPCCCLRFVDEARP